jgi:predicted ArsR family transcriptional regulator
MKTDRDERLEQDRNATLLGVTQSRWAILVYLLDHPDGSGSTAIASAVGLSAPATRFQLRQLVADGAVTSTLDPYFLAKGQRPRYFANREAIAEALRELGRHAGVTVVETEDIEPDELRRKIASRLRSILRLIDQADGQT